MKKPSRPSDEVEEESAREILFESPINPKKPSGGSISISQERLAGGVSEGVEVVYLDNGRLEVSILPTRGMGIWKVRDRRVEGDLGWDAPVKRPVHPSHVNQESRNGLGWLDGFNELLCRCGLSSNGPPGRDEGAKSLIESALTLHGRIANIPADETGFVVEGDNVDGVAQTTSIGLRGSVTEACLFGPQLQLQSTIRTVVESNEVVIEDVIINRASTATELQLLYHINIGRPFLEAGAKLHIPSRTIVPRDPRAAEGIDDWATYLGPTPGYTEEGFFFEPIADAGGNSVALLVNASGTLGVAVRFKVANLPRFVQWKCTQPEFDGYVTGLEPSTNYPNFKAYERQQGRVISLPAGQSYATRVSLTTLATKDEVTRVIKEVQSIQGDRPPVLHRTPQPGWSPAGEPK